MEWVNAEYERACGNLNLKPRYQSSNDYFSSWIRALRKRYNLTQAKLAEKLNTTVVTVAGWEDPHRKSLPSSANQYLLKQLERKLWMQIHWNDGVNLDTPATEGIKALIANSEDTKAQAHVDYLVEILAPHLPPIERSHLLHVAGLTYAVPAAQNTKKGHEYAELAYQEVMKLDESGPALQLRAAVENELLGYRCEALKNLPAGDEKQQEARSVVKSCIELFGKTANKEHIYLWNALECACVSQVPELITLAIKTLYANLRK